MGALKVTSIEALKKYSSGQVVELPPFADGQSFNARLRRPSMLVLIRSGRIPNALLETANGLFLKGGVNGKKLDSLKDALDVIDILCEASFVEPTFQEIKEAGIEMTDDQYMFVFEYTQRGVKALENFRQQPINNPAAGNVAEVQRKAIGTPGN